MKDLFSVEDKIVVITGALGQLGSNYAKEFLRRGAKVACFEYMEPTKEVVERYFGEFADSENLHCYHVDITKKDQLNAALDEVEKLWGTPSVCVNNAGLDTQPSAPPEVSGPFEFFPEEVFRQVTEVNLVGTFLVDQAVGARMAKAGIEGSIINIGSIYGMVSPVQDIYAYKKEMTGIPFVKPVAYSASKSGVYNLTRYCATYWAKNGIRVNTFTPAGVWRKDQDDYFHANYEARIPIGRMAKEDEYNGAIIFLASDASKYMTGSNLIMDGGWTAW